MADVSEDIAVRVLDSMDKLALAASDVLDKYAEPATELAFAVLRIDAASKLFPWLIVLVCGILVLNKWLLPFFKDKSTRFSQDTIIGMAFLTIITGVLSLIAAVKLFNIWAWVGLFYPEIYAVHKFILT